MISHEFVKTSIQSNVFLNHYSTLKIGGPAEWFAEPRTCDELSSVMAFGREKELPFFVIGRGSNLLFPDRGYPGLIISLKKLNSQKFDILPNHKICVSGGMHLLHLSLLCQEQALGGTEFLCHIPGTVGGAIVMNAGFGRPDEIWHDMSDILESITIMNSSGHVETLPKSDIHFGYRSSQLPKQSLILEAVLKTSKKQSPAVSKEIKANFAYRDAVQDLRYPSAGSFFKNPNDRPLSSGKMLDKAQMKGYRVGRAMFSERHANFLLNLDHATAEDVIQLKEIAQKRVFELFGVALEPEVKYVTRNEECW